MTALNYIEEVLLGAVVPFTPFIGDKFALMRNDVWSELSHMLLGG